MALDKNHCCTAFKYTKPLQFRTVTILKHTEEHTAVSMKAKEVYICKSAFPKPTVNLAEPLVLFSGVVYKKVTEKAVSSALIT